MIAFTQLERAALRAIFEETPAWAADLMKQLDAAVVTERRNTGVGFFTTIQVSDGVAAVETPRVLGHTTHARIEGLTYGLGFVLFMSAGRLDLLEAYSHGGETTTNLQLNTLTFQIADTPFDA